MDTYVVKLDGVEVARLTGEGLEHGHKLGEIDPKLVKKNHNGQTLFVLMGSSQKNVSVEKL